MTSTNEELFYFKPICCDEVRNVVMSMPSNKASGPYQG